MEFNFSFIRRLISPPLSLHSLPLSPTPSGLSPRQVRFIWKIQINRAASMGPCFSQPLSLTAAYTFAYIFIKLVVAVDAQVRWLGKYPAAANVPCRRASAKTKTRSLLCESVALYGERRHKNPWFDEISPSECVRGAYAAANKCEKFNIEKRDVLSALTLFGSNRLSSAIFPMKHPLRMECCGLVRVPLAPMMCPYAQLSRSCLRSYNFYNATK